MAGGLGWTETVGVERDGGGVERWQGWKGGGGGERLRGWGEVVEVEGDERPVVKNSWCVGLKYWRVYT